MNTQLTSPTLIPFTAVHSWQGSPTSDQLLAISEHKKSGLILCKDYHAEFVGPGAAIASPVEQPYRAMIAIGSPEFVPVKTPEQRRQSYGHRIQWGRWLHRIAEQSDPEVRVERLFDGLEGFFGRQVVMVLPVEVVAALVGVLPQTVAAVRRRYIHPGPWDKTTLLFPSQHLKVTMVNLAQGTPKIVEVPLTATATMRDIQVCYAQLRFA